MTSRSCIPSPFLASGATELLYNLHIYILAGLIYSEEQHASGKHESVLSISDVSIRSDEADNIVLMQGVS
jgi:hypothetical protein